MPPNKAARGKFQVLFLGEPDALRRSFGQLDERARGLQQHADRRKGKLAKWGVGTTAAIGAVAAAARQVYGAANDSEVSTARLEAQFKASGFELDHHAKRIDEVVQRTSKLAGLDDEDLQDAFTHLLHSTGSVKRSLNDVGLVADLARAKHIEVAKAGELVAKVEGGNVGILRRYGIMIDKNASSADALAALHRKFDGQAKAYGDTTQGAYDKFQVAQENLNEAIGTRLQPLLTELALAGLKLIHRVGPVVMSIAHFIGSAAHWTSATTDTVIRDVKAIPGALGDGISWAFDRIKAGSIDRLELVDHAASGMVGDAVAAEKRLLAGAVKDIGGRLVSGLLHGLINPAGIVKFLLGALGGPAKLAEKFFGAIGDVGGFIGGLFGGGGGKGERVGKAIVAMSAIAGRHLPYTYGGGHGRLGVGNPGFDCSGYVSVALGILGTIGGPMAVREPMASALARGPGEHVTVGIRGTSGQNAHTMIKIDGKYFESGGGHGPAQVGGWDGAFEMFHPPGYAQGGDFITRGPYAFLAGEQGPERVSIMPAGARPRRLRITGPVIRTTADAHELAHRVAFHAEAAACC